MTHFSHARATPWIAALGLIALLAGCGGGEKSAQEPTPAPAEPVEPVETEDELIPPEKLDQIQTFFDRKRRVVTRCYTQALESGDLSKNAEGYVTVSVTITTSGSLSNASIADATLESDSLNECILGYVEKWTVTSLPKPLDYTYSFRFLSL